MGSQYALSSREIIARFYMKLEETVKASWISQLARLFMSNQAQETYKWLGMTPALREWIGGRNAKGFRENGLTIINKKYEATVEVNVDDLRRANNEQIYVRIDDLAIRATQHWAKLLTTLIINGETTVCYDGQLFFDTDHSEGDSGTQSNDLSVTIASAPVAVHGSTTAPSAEELGYCIFKAIAAILGFKDDQGEPMNDGAQNFIVMVPVSYMAVAIAALKNPVFAGGVTNTLVSQSTFNIVPVVNPRLTWTTELAVFRADGAVTPLIRQAEAPEGGMEAPQGQDEVDVKMSAIAEGSEEEFKYNRHLYGVEANRNVGYGYWQEACLVTLA